MNLAPFIKTGRGIHPVVDLDLLKATYPSPEVDIWNISSASELLSWELLREQHHIQDPEAVSCDLFLWGTGMPPDARMTRVGGLPWLPKRCPWPVIDGAVASFLCQFNFQDSRDLTGQRVASPLPGDILLVFVANDMSAPSGNLDAMRFIWVSADETDVITEAEAPAPTHPFTIMKAWGARYRSSDVPSKWEEAFEIPDDVAGGRADQLPVLWGTKIGGVPYHSQDSLLEAPPDFLCQLVSIQPAHETSWPWVDRESPLTLDGTPNGIYHPGQSLMIGDLGEISFYLAADGRISVESACG